MRISWLGLLGLLFIGLKLTGYITWSWWWVLAPLWSPLAILAIITILITLIAVISVVLEK